MRFLASNFRYDLRRWGLATAWWNVRFLIVSRWVLPNTRLRVTPK